MNNINKIKYLLFFVALAVNTAPALAQPAAKFPTKPVRIIVAFPPGSSTDIVARVVGERLTELWGQNVIIENRPGASGNIGTQVALRANPDGHTLFMNSSAIAVNVSLYAKPGYAMKDIVPILQGPTTPNLITVHPSLNVKTLQELIALAKSKPLSYGSSGTGTTPHLDMELLFKTLAKVDITHVPYSPAAAASAVVGNQVPVGSTSMPPAVPFVKSGRLRAIAVTTAKRSAVLPDVPTVAESGFPGFDDYTWFSVFAPVGVPAAVVNQVNRDFTAALQSPAAKERLAALSLEFAPNTPAEFATRLKTEVAKYAQIVKQSGARVD
ncbi:MAG: tripartite tricarboxylate transporter substrate binding protein [Burkholderiales bacterium]|jgi:tripartite-type tricarboxylate transporter receptor subunit TctC|nr:tripartite tricarboxylate transporter substrate binding protein [Burkholderiales bacterium]